MVKFTGTESRLRSPGAGAAENGELLLNVYRVATGVMKTFWKQRAVTAVSHNILNARNSTLKMVKTANLVPHTHTHIVTAIKKIFSKITAAPSPALLPNPSTSDYKQMPVRDKRDKDRRFQKRYFPRGRYSANL